LSGSNLPRLLSIMGSGETAPTMIKFHRRVFDELGPPPVPAVFLDTPFGFQENADELSAKTIDYFKASVGREITVAGLRRTIGADTMEIESALSAIRQASWVFAGPGSPTYALRQWAGTPVASTLRERLTAGGAVTFSSAAALTLGVKTVPVYEIYKVGADPYWLEGLDVLSAVGLRVVVIPHYDNAEGGHHDTRFCYLGETRLARLERELDDDVFVLGVDEHTALHIDLETEQAEVIGRGGITLRRQGRSLVIPAGETVSLELIRHAGEGAASAAPAVRAGAAGAAGGDAGASAAAPAPREQSAASLGGETTRLEQAFTEALAAGNAERAAAAALDLEQAIVDWSRDALQSDEADRAHAALRSMIVRLGEAAVGGLRDPRDVLGPVVQAALALRQAVRSEKRYDLSDLLRDGLAGAGIEVRDTAEGPQWELTG
jgi:hypothetical protein